MRKLPDGVEVKLENEDTKATMEYILELRAEAKRQKLQKDVKAFAKTFGNEGKDVPKFNEESLSEMDKLAEEFEITDE